VDGRAHPTSPTPPARSSRRRVPSTATSAGPVTATGCLRSGRRVTATGGNGDDRDRGYRPGPARLYTRGWLRPELPVRRVPERRAASPASDDVQRCYPARFSHFRKTNGYANLPLDGLWLERRTSTTDRSRLAAQPASASGRVLHRLRRVRLRESGVCHQGRTLNAMGGAKTQRERQRQRPRGGRSSAAHRPLMRF
jgi:hypothetical protein